MYDDIEFSKLPSYLCKVVRITLRKHHRLNSAIYSVLIEDVDEKVNRPKTVSKGSRVFYNFE